jgi:hypothetical protein
MKTRSLEQGVNFLQGLLFPVLLVVVLVTVDITEEWPSAGMAAAVLFTAAAACGAYWLTMVHLRRVVRRRKDANAVVTSLAAFTDEIR